MSALLKAILTISLLPFYLAEKVFIHLDSHWSWFITASARSLFLLKKHRATLIYSTAGPSSTHLAGYLLHRATGIPWLVELHDPMVHAGSLEQGQRGAFHRWLEAKICRHASAVVFFTRNALTNAIIRNPGLAGKGFTLRPGAKPPDFSGVSYRQGEQFHIGHFGSLARDRNLAVLIKAVYEILEKNPAWRELVRLDIYGSDLDPVSEEQLIRFPLPGVLVRHGRLEIDPLSGKSGRQRILEVMRQCDLLLVIHGESTATREYVPSKIYEYLLTRRPVLGLAQPESELGQIMDSIENCWCVPPERGAAGEIISVLFERWKSQGLLDRRTDSPFTVEAAARRILQLAEKTAF